MILKFQKLVFIVFFSISSLASAADSSFLQVIIDKSGSMAEKRSDTGNTRYFDAVWEAYMNLLEAKVEADSLGGELNVAIATFDSIDGFNQIHKFGDGDVADAGAVLTGLLFATPAGGTNLADAVCKGAQKLNAQSRPDAYKRVLNFYTDLKENNSDGDICGGKYWDADARYYFFSVSPRPMFNVKIYSEDNNILPFIAPNESSGVALNLSTPLPDTITEEILYLTSLSRDTRGIATGIGDGDNVKAILEKGRDFDSCNLTYFYCPR